MKPVLLSLLALLYSFLLPAWEASARGGLPIGINLTSVCYWSTEHPFVDVFKQSQPWQAQRTGAGYGEGGQLVLDEKGWVRVLQPGQWADALVCRSNGHYPRGEYVCLYEGEGTLEFGFDARILHQEQGRILLNVSPSKNGIVLRLKETNPKDPVRNIRLITPGFEETYADQVFHPRFLERWADFSVIRFMDWMRTNNSSQKVWAHRPTVDAQTQGSDRGVALEHMILLANRLKAHPWFCMPHEADHDYVERFARKVKEDLDPELKVYVEYSNEVWNFQFKQAHYALAVGEGLGLSKNGFEASLSFYARRSKEIFQIWEEVFQGTDRLVRVVSAQSRNPWTSQKILNFERTFEYADALAIAPYFGNALGAPEKQDLTSRLTTEHILSECRRDMRLQHEKVAVHAELARKAGLDLIAYEGGQHLVGTQGAENHPELTAAFVSANRHPGMKALYLEDLEGWKRAGGGLFAAFASMGSYGKWGSWGLLEHEEQDPATAPKYQALMDVIRKSNEKPVQ